VKKTESRAIETDPIIFATPSVSRHIKTDNIHNTVVNGCDLTLDSLPSTSQSSHNFGTLPSADAISEEPQEIEGGEKNRTNLIRHSSFQPGVGMKSQMILKR
jgi:hypothetical protein